MRDFAAAVEADVWDAKAWFEAGGAEHEPKRYAQTWQGMRWALHITPGNP